MTERAARRPVYGSVFAKLLVVMLTMAVVLLLIVSVFFYLLVGPNLGISQNLLAEYARAVAATSPDVAAARRLAARVDVEMRYEGPDGSWTTADTLPTVAQARRRGAGDWYREGGGRDYYLVRRPSGGTYLFFWEVRQQMYDAHVTLIWMLLALMVGVVLMAHVVLRRLLRPLRGLNDGVARLSDGQLDIVLPERTRDEFGVLTAAFNEMVGRVRQMIRARDQLLLDVSHELRSPLTRLRVALELLPVGTPRARMAGDVAEMEAMIAELLELERLRDGRGLRLARRDLLAVLRDVAERFRDRAPGVRVIASARTIVLDIDEDKVRTVVRNLLENAIKYSLQDSRAVEVAATVSGDAAVVSVRDDGPGIPEEDAAHLFEPFFRVDRSRSKKTGGYGLGLSICKRIMDAHGGAIAVERHSVRGARDARGASFILTFPLPRSGGGAPIE